MLINCGECTIFYIIFVACNTFSHPYLIYEKNHNLIGVQVWALALMLGIPDFLS